MPQVWYVLLNTLRFHFQQGNLPSPRRPHHGPLLRAVVIALRSTFLVLKIRHSTSWFRRLPPVSLLIPPSLSSTIGARISGSTTALSTINSNVQLSASGCMPLATVLGQKRACLQRLERRSTAGS